MIHAGARLRERRLALKLTENVVADAAGLTVSWYLDAEQHSDELLTNVPFRSIRKIATAVSIPIAELVSWVLNQPVPAPAQMTEQSLSDLLKAKSWQVNRGSFGRDWILRICGGRVDRRPDKTRRSAN
jgi:transcriptional regulator with XRE-family HTH domain